MPDRWHWLRQKSASSKRRTRLSFDLLEDRLTPSWGSLPPSTVVPPANFTPVTLDSQGDAAGNASIDATEVDWYKFTAPATGAYVFQAQTPSSNLDTVAGLYSSTGGRLAFNDDTSSTNSDSRFTATLTAGRVYYFGVTNYTGTPGGSYTWSIDGPTPGPLPPPPDDSYEDNDTFATAFNLGTVTAARTMSNLAMVDGQDWFRMTTAAVGTPGSSVSLAFQNAQGNIDLQLYDASGNLVRSSATTADSETVSLDGLATGTYYVHAVAAPGVLNPNYTLTLTPPGAAPAPAGGAYDITLVTAGLTPSQRQIFEQAALKWESIISASLPAADYNGMLTNGVIINALSVPIDGAGGVLGQAGPDRYRTGNLLPYHGAMQFDTADVANLEANGGLYYTVLHEMGHILGIGTLWSSKGLLSGAGTATPLFTGAQATREYIILTNKRATGVPLETNGGSGTRDAHWAEAAFGNEIMTGYLNSGSNPLSRMTIASLADLGYSVDMSKAEPYTPNGGASGGGSGGGGPGLRAGTAVQDRLSQLANDVVKAAAINTRLNLPGTTVVQTAAGQTATAPRTSPVAPVATMLSPALTSARAAARTADVVFARLGLSASLNQPLSA